MGKFLFSFVCFVVCIGVIFGQYYWGWDWIGLPIVVLVVGMGWFVPAILAIGGSGRCRT